MIDCNDLIKVDIKDIIEKLLDLQEQLEILIANSTDVKMVKIIAESTIIEQELLIDRLTDILNIRERGIDNEAEKEDTEEIQHKVAGLTKAEHIELWLQGKVVPRKWL